MKVLGVSRKTALLSAVLIAPLAIVVVLMWLIAQAIDDQVARAEHGGSPTPSPSAGAPPAGP